MKENEKENIKMKALSDDDLTKVNGGMPGDTYYGGQELTAEGVTFHFPSECPFCHATTFVDPVHVIWFNSEGRAYSIICNAEDGHTYQRMI